MGGGEDEEEEEELVEEVMHYLLIGSLGVLFYKNKFGFVFLIEKTLVLFWFGRR